MRTLNDYFISGRVADISTAGSTFVAVPDGGRIIKIMTVLQGAISGGNAAITFEIGGTAVTGAGITVAHSGSAVGTMDSSVPTALNRVEEDGSIANSGRWLQWHWKGQDAPGEARNDGEILAGIYHHLRELYQSEGGKGVEPLMKMSWNYKQPHEPQSDEVAKENNGYALVTINGPKG